MDVVISAHYQAFQEYNKYHGCEPDMMVTSPKNWAELRSNSYTVDHHTEYSYRPTPFGQIASLWGVPVYMGIGLTQLFELLKIREPIKEAQCCRCWKNKFSPLHEDFLWKGYYPCIKPCFSYALPPDECPYLLEHVLIN